MEKSHARNETCTSKLVVKIHNILGFTNRTFHIFALTFSIKHREVQNHSNFQSTFAGPHLRSQDVFTICTLSQGQGAACCMTIDRCIVCSDLGRKRIVDRRNEFSLLMFII